jgi:hypothetical protein
MSRYDIDNEGELLWKRYELKPEWFSEIITHHLLFIEKFTVNKGIDATIAARESWISDRTNIFVFHHLGVDDSRILASECKELAHQCCNISVSYFYGDWRDGFIEWEARLPMVDHTKPWIKSGPLTLAECRNQLGWIDNLTYGLLWSLYFDREDAIEKLVAWPDTDLRHDEGVRDRMGQDCFFYILLCKMLRGQQASLTGELANNTDHP